MQPLLRSDLQGTTKAQELQASGHLRCVVAGEGIACTNECSGGSHSTSCKRQQWGISSSDENYYKFLMELAEEKEDDIPPVPQSRLSLYSGISGCASRRHLPQSVPP